MFHGIMLREMGQVQREFDGRLSHFGLGGPIRQVAESRPRQGHNLKVNLSEDADNLYLETLLPGADPEQIKMDLFGDTLTLSVEPLARLDESKVGVLRHSERNSTKVQRKIELPVQVEVEQVTAKYRQGLLRITLPKVAAVEPKRIEVKVC